MSDLKFEIKKSLGVLGQGINGWTKELNLVSWNERDPKLDIREWDEDHKKMTKGITFNKSEFMKLKEILDQTDESIIA